MLYIGIDPGKHTGLAVWDASKKAFLDVQTLLIHQAMDTILFHHRKGDGIFVFFEDARLRRWYTGDREKLQGAGSVKRDCTIWEDFLQDYGIQYRAVAPHRGQTKLTEDYFKALTGWGRRTSNHARDAAMLVFGR